MTAPSVPNVDREVLREAIQEEYDVVACEPVFEGAPQQSSAAEFGTNGINYRARKAD